MSKAIFLLLLLIVVGLIGYIAFPKSGKLTETSNKATSNAATTGLMDENKISQDELGTEATEVSEGLTLAISAPTDKSTVASQALQVIGKTSPNAEVFINDQEGKADSTGNFFINVSLDEGENVLSVVVNDQEGNYAEKELTVYLESTE